MAETETHAAVATGAGCEQEESRGKTAAPMATSLLPSRATAVAGTAAAAAAAAGAAPPGATTAARLLRGATASRCGEGEAAAREAAAAATGAGYVEKVKRPQEEEADGGEDTKRKKTQAEQPQHLLGVSLVAAVALPSRGIGFEGGLPWPRLSKDFKHFYRLTTTPVSPDPVTTLQDKQQQKEQQQLPQHAPSNSSWNSGYGAAACVPNGASSNSSSSGGDNCGTSSSSEGSRVRMHLPEQQRQFFNAVIMGRRTWESLPPAQRPLKKRLNIIISTTLSEEAANTSCGTGGRDGSGEAEATMRGGRADTSHVPLRPCDTEKQQQQEEKGGQLADAATLPEKQKKETDSSKQQQQQQNPLQRVRVCCSLPAALRLLQTTFASCVSHAFIVGGAQVYAAALSLGICSRMYLTRVACNCPADTYFPSFPGDAHFLGLPPSSKPPAVNSSSSGGTGGAAVAAATAQLNNSVPDAAAGEKNRSAAAAADTGIAAAAAGSGIPIAAAAASSLGEQGDSRPAAAAATGGAAAPCGVAEQQLSRQQQQQEGEGDRFEAVFISRTFVEEGVPFDFVVLEKKVLPPPTSAETEPALASPAPSLLSNYELLRLLATPGRQQVAAARAAAAAVSPALQWLASTPGDAEPEERRKRRRTVESLAPPAAADKAAAAGEGKGGQKGAAAAEGREREKGAAATEGEAKKRDGETEAAAPCWTLLPEKPLHALPSLLYRGHEEVQYLDLIADIINSGVLIKNRTGVSTLAKFGCMMSFSLEESFPLLTTKRVFWRGVVEELLWFVRGETDARKLSKKGVKIWDRNVSREFLDARGLFDRQVGDIGPGYGFQWRHFGAAYQGFDRDYSGKGIDQLQKCIDKLRSDPTDRRILFTAWNPAALDSMALPPCHLLAQFCVDDEAQLTCILYQRSCDVGLGVPFNIASYSLLTLMVAHITGLKAKKFVHFMGNTHVYSNHVQALSQQILRQPRPFPVVTIKNKERIREIDDFTAEDFELTGYVPHGKLPMDMAV